MAKQNGIYDEFNIDGDWFSPLDPTKRITGNISFNKSGIELNLHGSFNDVFSNFGEDKISKFDIILGYTNSGLITLLDGFETKFTFGGTLSTTLKFNRMIIGTHFNTKDEAVFDSVDINFSYLEEWLGHTPFHKNILYSDDKKFQQAQVVYLPPERDSFYIRKINTAIKTSYNMNFNNKHFREITMDHSSYLSICPDNPMNIDWFIDISNSIQDLLTLFLNRPVSPKLFKGKLKETLSNGTVKNNTVLLYMLPHYKFSEKEIHITDRYIKYHAIKNDLDKILNKWFESQEIVSPIKNYLRNINATDIDWETKFLNYAKALESLHRNISGDAGKFTEDHNYEPIKNAMIDALPTTIDPNLKQKLISTLKYAHHYGFQRRVRELLLSLPINIKNIMFESDKKLKEFSSSVTTSRDYYTHYGDLPEYYFYEWDLHYANQRLHTVLFYHLNKYIEVNENLLETLIVQNDQLVRTLENAKTLLPN